MEVAAKSNEHHMHLYEEFFKKVQSGQKTVEIRKWDEKRKKIQIGDTLVFERENSGLCIVTHVQGIYVYKDIYDLCILARKFTFEDTGHNSWEALRASLRRIYGLDTAVNMEVVAIKIKPFHEKSIHKGEN